MDIEKLLQETKSYMNKANNECNNEAEDYFFQIALALMSLKREFDKIEIKEKDFSKRVSILSKAYRELVILEDKQGLDVEVISIQALEHILTEVLN